MSRRLELLAALLCVWTARWPVHAGVAEKDWIDSPITGQGERPANGTTVFLSVYLDRLLFVDQQNYGFHVGAEAGETVFSRPL